MSPPGRSFGVAMVAACPFPANHGTPGKIREMAEALAQRGHRVHVVTYPMHQPIPVNGLSIHRVGSLLRARPIAVGPTIDKPLLDLLMIARLVRCLRRHDVDLIHAHNYEGALVGHVARRITGVPLIYNAINTMEDELPSYDFIRPRRLALALARALDRHVPRQADHVIARSQELVTFLAARGVPPARMTLIPSAVNPEMFDGADPAALRRRLHLDDEPLVVYTGTLDRFQRVDYLIQAMGRVVSAVPAARLVLGVNIARDEDAARTLAQARELGIGDRLAIVRTSLEELPAVLAAADVTVAPRPACPGVPAKLLNYMAARKPIVTFRGSAKGLVHLQTGFLAEDHDWAGLADGIVTLLQDRVLAGRLGQAARAALPGRLDWASVAQRVEDVYERVHAERERAAGFVHAS